MSTRCHIAFYDKKDDALDHYQVLLYKHSDGYPNGKAGVLYHIKPFLKAFKKSRGLNDCEYAAAWLLHHLIDDHIKAMTTLFKHMVEVCKKRGDKDGVKHYSGESGVDYLGHGVCGDRQIHWDIEYFYRIYPNAVEVYEVTHDKKDYNPLPMQEWKLLKTVKL